MRFQNYPDSCVQGLKLTDKQTDSHAHTQKKNKKWPWSFKKISLRSAAVLDFVVLEDQEEVLAGCKNDRCKEINGEKCCSVFLLE